MDHIVERIVNDIKRTGVLNYKGPSLVRLGCGHFSSVYAHPEDTSKVIKITTSDVANDGYPLFVDYIKSKPEYSIYPVVYEMHELNDKNDHPFNVSVSERLYDYYTLPTVEQAEVKHMFGALISIDNNFMIDAVGDSELISKLFRKYKESIPFNWGQLNTAQSLEVLEAHTMIYTLCSEWEPNWGMMPDIGGSNVMVRKTAQGTLECVITDPIACGDVFRCDEEYIG